MMQSKKSSSRSGRGWTKAAVFAPRKETDDDDVNDDHDVLEEEEEEENDENDPAPSPAPVKKTSRRAAPKAKKADAVKAEEAPARSSRRALRANR